MGSLQHLIERGAVGITDTLATPPLNAPLSPAEGLALADLMLTRWGQYRQLQLLRQKYPNQPIALRVQWYGLAAREQRIDRTPGVELSGRPGYSRTPALTAFIGTTSPDIVLLERLHLGPAGEDWGTLTDALLFDAEDSAEPSTKIRLSIPFPIDKGESLDFPAGGVLRNDATRQSND